VGGREARSRWPRSGVTRTGRSVSSRSPPFRGSRTLSGLRRQRWWRCSGGGWSRPQRCVPCKMERSGCKGWWTTTVGMPCASWMRAHAAEYVNEIGQAVQAAGGRLPARWLEGVLHRLKHQGPERVLKHLAWLVARYPSPGVQENLSYLQKREAHMGVTHLSASRLADWLRQRGKCRVSVVVEARLKGAGMRGPRHNVNPMLVLRHAVCNRRWHETWTTARAHQAAQRTSRRQARSQQRLNRAFWTLVYWGARLARLSQPPVQAVPSPAVQANAELPIRRLGTGYSWRKPFLRRPPSTPVGLPEACAKK
jgi:hypothetical protein